MKAAETFPVRLIRLRRSADMTQCELAAKLQVNKSLVGHWETGLCLPRFVNLVHLAELLGCSLDDLMRGEVLETSLPPEPIRGPRNMVALPARRSGVPIAFGIGTWRRA